MDTMADFINEKAKYELVLETEAATVYYPSLHQNEAYELEGYIDDEGRYNIEIEVNQVYIKESVEWLNVENKPSEFPPEYHSHLSDNWLLNLMAGYSSSNHNHSGESWLMQLFAGYATQEFVNTRFEQLVDNSPLFLDTINELASALGNDPNFATTVLGELDKKALKTDLLTPVPLGAAFTDTQLTPAQVVAAIDLNLGQTDWKTGGGVMSGAEIEAALDLYFGSEIWKYDNDTNTHLTDAQVVTAINTALGNTTWQTGGGTMSGADIIAAINTELAQSTWQAQYSHPVSHAASMITEEVDKRWFLDAERTKLTGIEAEANKYIHPVSHLPSIITQDANNRFVSVSQISTWDGKATTAYVDAAVASILDAAPEMLNTLDELAAALGDDPNFATTISNQIGLKANSADVYLKTAVDTALGQKEGLISKALGFAKWTAGGWSFVDESYSLDNHLHTDVYAPVHSHPYRADTWNPTWDDVSGKPSTFAPSAHNHDGVYSASAHDHSGVYEPAITKSTGFMKWNGSVLIFVNDAYALATAVQTNVPAGAVFTDTQLSPTQVVSAVDSSLGYTSWKTPIWSGTQAQYDALTPDSGTVYLIEE